MWAVSFCIKIRDNRKRTRGRLDYSDDDEIREVDKQKVRFIVTFQKLNNWWLITSFTVCINA